MKYLFVTHNAQKDVVLRVSFVLPTASLTVRHRQIQGARMDFVLET